MEEYFQLTPANDKKFVLPQKLRFLFAYYDMKIHNAFPSLVIWFKNEERKLRVQKRITRFAKISGELE